MKKSLIFLLAALVLSSCAGAGDDTAAQTTAGETTAAMTEAETESLFEPDNLPDTLDFGGETMDVYIGNYNDAYYADLYSEAETGNRFSDTIYHMLKGIEERLNVKLEYTDDPFTYAEIAAHTKRITSMIMAGDDAVDLIIGAVNFSSVVNDGEYFMNLAELPYVDLEKPWYNRSVIENMPDDYIYFTLGSFSIANVKNTFGIYFNQSLLNTMDIDADLYQMVDDGTWTIEALEGLVKDTYADLDGDMKKSGADQFGMTFGDANKYLGLLPAFEVKMFEKTEDGYAFTYNSERAASVVERMCDWINASSDVAPAMPNIDGMDEWQMTSGGGNYVSRAFMEGRALFSASLIADAQTIVAGIDFEYGLLPYPKWDETQSAYQTTLQRAAYALIPTTANAETASALLEAISSASYRTLIPEYFEVTLKTRYSQDNDTSRMYDLIANSVVYDPGEIFGTQLGGPSGLVRDAIKNNKPNWASTIKSNEKKLTKIIGEIAGE